jgi:HD-like signal output (HDOD) protein/CheY-like chemotaxis protein
VKRSVLFVDDEINILNGLQRMLRAKRVDWEMSFSSSGEEAIQILETRPVDVVVTDMRMPRMDGAELLSLVKERFPEVVRIILSGYSEKVMIMKAVRLAHQYLVKPSDANELINVISRTCALKELLGDVRLKELVSRIETLPSQPAVYTRVMELLDREGTSIKQIGEAIADDLGMSAKILQLVNSAFFGLPKRFMEVTEAVMYLGLDTISTLVLTCGLFMQFDSKKSSGLDVEALFTHCQQTSALSKAIIDAEKLNKEVADEARLAGLMHDVGVLVIADRFPDQYREILLLKDSLGCDSHEAEMKVLGTTHAELGAYLMGLWGLSTSIVEAIAFHHRPGDCPAMDFQPLAAIHAADAYIRKKPGGPDGAYFERLALMDRLPVWKELAERMEQEQQHDS